MAPPRRQPGSGLREAMEGQDSHVVRVLAVTGPSCSARRSRGPGSGGGQVGGVKPSRASPPGSGPLEGPWGSPERRTWTWSAEKGRTSSRVVASSCAARRTRSSARRRSAMQRTGSTRFEEPPREGTPQRRSAGRCAAEGTPQDQSARLEPGAPRGGTAEGTPQTRSARQVPGVSRPAIGRRAWLACHKRKAPATVRSPGPEVTSA